MKKLLAMLVLFSAASPVLAASQTVTLLAPGMNCPTCPYTVKKALLKVEGVSKAEVNYAAREIIVTYEDTKASLKALTSATENAGYPSTVKS